MFEELDDPQHRQIPALRPQIGFEMGMEMKIKMFVNFDYLKKKNEFENSKELEN